MKSSNMENMFNYTPSVEETKSLSPLTYYQPFQSSFDPEFAMSTAKTVTRPDPSLKRWRQGAEKPGTGLQTPRGPAFNLWEDTTSGFSPDIHPPLRLQPPYPIVGGSTSGWTTEHDRRSISEGPVTSPWPNIMTISPDRISRQMVPGFGEDLYSPFLTPRDVRSGMCSPYPIKSSYGCEASAMTPNRQQSSFRGGGAFGYANAVGQPRQVSPGYDGGSHGSLCHPLIMRSFGKTVPQNLYKTGHGRPMMCNFCKNNKEVPDIYLNHYLYDPETKVLTCPVLRKHVCEICGGTGDRAHTLQYCPVNRERGLQAKVPVLLKTRTITNSTGKIRRN